MLRISNGMQRGLGALVLLCFVFFLSSCASFSRYQSKLNGFIINSDYSQAQEFLDDNPYLYGRKNTLLYFFDKGLILHLAKDYKKSIDTFEKSKLRFDELYTKSITGIVSTWVINDYMSAYRGEDFERVMINIFQSLNYLMLGNLGEALVEARDVDSRLNLINSRYKANEKNAYKEDAFARFFMGILYEADKTREGYNNAFISYSKAVETYESDYAGNYNLDTPEILKENILAAAKFMGFGEFEKYRAKYGKVKFLSLEEKAKKAEIYLVQYNGLSPEKVENMLPVPFPDGYVVKYAFPSYNRRYYYTRAAIFSAKNKRNESFEAETQLGEDISAIAIKNLDDRKVRFIAKEIARSTGKYLIERKQGEVIRKRYGDTAASVFKIFSSLFNVFSSNADLRSWQSLPAEIRIARLVLEPGEYDFSSAELDAQNQCSGRVDLGKINVSAGEKRFFVIRSVR